MIPEWDDLSDDELLARLEARDVPTVVARRLVWHRDDPDERQTITTLLDA